MATQNYNPHLEINIGICNDNSLIYYSGCSSSNSLEGLWQKVRGFDLSVDIDLSPGIYNFKQWEILTKERANARSKILKIINNSEESKNGREN